MRLFSLLGVEMTVFSIKRNLFLIMFLWIRSFLEASSALLGPLFVSSPIDRSLLVESLAVESSTENGLFFRPVLLSLFISPGVFI